MISLRGSSPHYNVYEALTKRPVSAKFDRAQLEEVRDALGRRVNVSGIIHRNANGEPITIERGELNLMREEEALPTVDDIAGIDPDYTGSRNSAEYVRAMRDA